MWRPIVNKYGKKGTIVLAAVAVCTAFAGGNAVRAVLLGGSGTPTTVNSIELSRGLVGHWKFDGNAKDSTPNSNNGSVSGATLVADRKGNAGKAYDFTSNDTITLPSASELNNSVFTYAVWIKMEAIPTTNQDTIIASGNGGTHFLVNENMRVQLDQQQQGIIGQSTGSLALNVWTHVAVTYSSSGAYKFYINGLPSGTGTALRSFSFSDFRIGTRYSPDGHALNGDLDDLRIYNRVLSDAEAKTLAESYDSSLELSAGQKGLVGHWKLDGNAKDSTPNASNCVPTYGGTLIYANDRKGAPSKAMNVSTNSGRFLSCTNNPKLRPSSSITLSAWVKPDDHTYSEGGGIVNFQSWYRFYFDTDGGLILALTDVSNNLTSYKTSSTFPAGSWYHVLATYDGSVVKIYVNGTEEYSAARSGALGWSGVADTSQFNIGTYSAPSSGRSLHGDIDDVRVYDRAISIDEVTNLYRRYDSNINTHKGTGNSINLSQGLIGHWAFNGNSNDNTPFSNNFSRVGGVLGTDRRARSNSAYVFDGIDDRFSASADLFRSTHNSGRITYALWYNATGNNTLWHMGNAGSCRYEPRITPTNFYLSGCGGTGHVAAYSPVAGWNHLVISIDNSVDDIKIYLNGNLVSDTSVTAVKAVSDQSAAVLNLSTSYNTINLAAQHNSGSYTSYVAGSIDEIRIYKRPLSAAEAQALYNLYQ